MSKLDLGPIGMTVQISADGRHTGEAAELASWGDTGAITARTDEYLQAGADHLALTVLDSGHSAIDSARCLLL